MARRVKSDLERELERACAWAPRDPDQVVAALAYSRDLSSPRIRAIFEEAARLAGPKANHADVAERLRLASGAKTIAFDAHLASLCDLVERRLGMHGEDVKRQEREMLERIYGSEDDDEVRSLYADWLAARGDPRGEFVAMQLDTTVRTATREAEMLGRYRDVWTGSLAGLVDHAVFRRGFIERCRALRNDEWAFHRDEWATVRTLELEYTARDLALPARWFRALRQVGFLEWRALEDVASSEDSAGLTHVGVQAFELPTRPTSRAIASGPGLRHLARLDIVLTRAVDVHDSIAAVQTLLDAGPAGWRELGVEASPADLAMWTEWFSTQSKLDALHVGLGESWRFLEAAPISVVVTRGPEGVSLDAQTTRSKARSHERPAWTRALKTLDSAKFVRLRIDGSPRKKPKTR